MSDDALESCLATKARDHVALRLGLSGSDCGTPPFDEHVPQISLWSWPWTAWPAYDEAIFEIDKRRIVRWYQARGFYSARVVGVSFFANGERVTNPSECPSREQSACKIEIRVQVDEGEPVQVRALEVVGAAAAAPLDPELGARLRKAAAIAPGDRFDEAAFEAGEQRMQRLLEDHAYARAKVVGEVELDRSARTALVRYRVTTGPLCRFGKVRVYGQGQLDGARIAEVAGIPSGKPYARSELVDAERAVYALGTFRSVRASPVPGAGDDPVVDVAIDVSPGRTQALRLGFGVMSGELTTGTGDETVAVPEWDVHLRAFYRNDDFVGGMRRLRVEERPRVIMLDSFPTIPASGPRLGNFVQVSLEQPRFVEHRTVLFTTHSWDLGPDPFLGFFRHVVSSRLGVKRAFFGRRLQLSVAAAHDFYEIIDHHRPSDVSSYRLPFLDEQLKLDLRDDAHRPRRGLYLGGSTQQAFRFGYGSWSYTRFLPELRLYEPLPLHIVLAQRFALGMLFVASADRKLDATSQTLGPQEYRLRGGGASSNRGFAPGRLGDGVDGGRRRWEASLELRLPLSRDIGFVLFLDAGDVHRERRLRFDHPNAATGFGLRYYGLFVPLRLDLGWRIPGWQVIGGPDPHVNLRVLPSAAHVTIGEAF